MDATSPSAAGLVTRLAEQFLTTHQGIGARASGAGRAGETGEGGEDGRGGRAKERENERVRGVGSRG
jgi:hypothetical protein